MRKVFYILVAVATTTLLACAALKAKEIARISIEQLSTSDQKLWKQTSVDLKKGDILRFWTEMDMEFEDDLKLEYQVQYIKNSDTLGYITLNPFERKVSVGESKASLMNKTTWSFGGQMDILEITENAKYTFRVILVSNGNETLKLNKADFVLKK